MTNVAHALMRAASRLISTPAQPYRAVTTGSGFRQEPA